jgi:hypothetical protein
MIRGFQHRGLKRPYELDDKSGIRPDMLSKVENSWPCWTGLVAPIK